MDPKPGCGFVGSTHVCLRDFPLTIQASKRPGVLPLMLFSALFQTIMEQFNPSLRNFIAMGKNYEKALAGEACGWE